ncbi:hypothetical protein BS47DRAFT_1378132 [Hydnum rufescens UP504]|uniref:Amino acid transporter transmembrane domain-containing protein n=1 Tax=Hydnum rufescens UP504 TaxID=1448309 RepID=A0A9P6DPI7_9AGAM|nr:hypothetical protein BS47DRAFT_1378132 [Hydnum rufescens UP504]
MPPTYGVANDSRASEEATGVPTPYTPLLGTNIEAAAHRQLKSEGIAGISSSVGNLCNTILGTGILAFPLAMASSGLIPGIITCIFSGSVAGFGLYLLSRCASQTPHRRSSFFAVAQLTYPSLAVFFDAAVAIKCFGVSTSYLIIIKGLMPSVVGSLHYVLNPSSEIPWWTNSGRFWITIFMAILVPLCFLRHLDSFRHTSYVALFSVAYVVIIVVVCHFDPPKGSTEPGEWHLVHFTPSFISTFPVQVFAFTCAQNLFPIYNELASNTQSRMNLVIGASLGTTTLTYEIVSIFGYITFGSNVGPNIIAMYPSTTLFIALGQFAIVLLVLFSYPLQVHPCRICLDKILPFKGYTLSSKSAESCDAENEETEEEEENLSAHGAVHELTPLRHTILTYLIVVPGFLVAYFVDDLQLVLSFVGSTGSTAISFILPGLFYYKLFGDQPGHSKAMKWASAALALYGVLIFIFCLTFNIWKVLQPIKDIGQLL